jgi:ribosomal protein S18 acetylase RimI-like enzyme
MDATATFKIELARAVTDAEVLVPLVDAYRAFYGEAPSPEATAAFVRGRFSKGDTQFFVARNGAGAAVGFAHLLFSLETISLAPIGILEDIYVAEAARGAGIGGALLDAAEAFARERGLRRLTLSTAHQNRTAQRLYLAHGYVPDQRFRSFNRFLENDAAAT